MNWAGALRVSLAGYAERYAKANALPYYCSRGATPTILFESYDAGNGHGNFLTASYYGICNHPEWSQRLRKPHQNRRALPPERQEHAKELDCSNSSDALLMNIFCHPDLRTHAALTRLLGRRRLGASPEFGIPGTVPLVTGKPDRSEIDMRMDGRWWRPS